MANARSGRGKKGMPFGLEMVILEDWKEALRELGLRGAGPSTNIGFSASERAHAKL
jgi:hypothetical protein